MALRAGQVVTLKVEREAEFGVFLSNGEEDILLHNNEQTKKLELDEEVEVFLYQDNEGRLASSMTIPEASFEDYVKTTINGTRYNTGVFANIGIQKDVLVSLDDLPQRRTFWPENEISLYPSETRLKTSFAWRSGSLCLFQLTCNTSTGRVE